MKTLWTEGSCLYCSHLLKVWTVRVELSLTRWIWGIARTSGIPFFPTGSCDRGRGSGGGSALESPRASAGSMTTSWACEGHAGR